MYVCMYVTMYVRMYVCMYVRMYVCMYVCMHVCMYFFPPKSAYTWEAAGSIVLARRSKVGVEELGKCMAALSHAAKKIE